MEKYQDQPGAVPNYSPRGDLLRKALKIVSEDRNSQYGEPEDNFGNIAAYWQVYLNQTGAGFKFQPHDVALLMILMKVARLGHNPNHEDSWEDIAGYAACGFDCVCKGRPTVIKGEK